VSSRMLNCIHLTTAVENKNFEKNVESAMSFR